MLDLTKYTRNGRDTRLGFGLFVLWWKCGTSVGVVVTQAKTKIIKMLKKIDSIKPLLGSS